MLRLTWIVLWGSSPRMRGTHNATFDMDSTMGIIPAYAGNTTIVPVPHIHCWDHPRVCGEHFGFCDMVDKVPGSSPRMRGTPIAPDGTVNLLGIIPAYAGNTRSTSRQYLQARDHPRVCGEHVSWQINRKQPPGSSPRMRGTLRH